MVTKQDFLTIFKKEFATTLKVIKAFPGDKLDFAPHERSQNAGRLMSTFIFELYLLKMIAFGKEVDRSIFQTYSPDSIETIAADFEKESSEIFSILENIDEKVLGKTVEFAGKEFIVNEFMLMMLFDQIHHRGQMSVYIRLAGGKVPSIYGPSADDSSNNL
jgi:uncharacterized damage-inducible protein DinB